MGMTIILLLLIGFLASTYGVIIGAGGGFIFVPLLLIFYDIPPAMAAGTGLCIALLSGVSGIFGYIKQKRIQYRIGLLLAAGAIPGTLLGNQLVRIVPETLFLWLFALMLVALGFFLLIKKPKDETNQVKEQLPHWLLPIIGVGVGTMSSFFGVGGGFLVVPILIYLIGMRMHLATATSIFSLVLYSTAGVITPMISGNIDWFVFTWVGVGVLMGSQLGAYISTKLKAIFITRMLAAVVIIMGVSLMF